MVLGVLLLGAFTTSLNVSLLSPLLPAIGKDLGVSTATAGQLSTVGALFAGIAAFMLAPWMDRRPRGWWLRREGVLLAVGSLLCALAPSFCWLVAGRAATGLGSAVLGATCFAAVADILPDPVRRNRAIGLVATALTLGTVAGLPALTLLNHAVGWRWAILSPAPLAFAVVAGSLLLPERMRTDAPPTSRGWRAGYGGVLGQPTTVWLLGVVALSMAVWFGWLMYLGSAAEESFGVGPGLLSLLFLASGGAEIVANTLASALVRRWPARGVEAVAIGMLALALFGVGVVFRSGVSLFPFVALASFAGAMIFVCGNVLLLESAPDARGAVMALQSAALQLGGAVGVSITGAAVSILGDYPAAFRLLGVLALLSLACLRAGGERRQARLAAAGGGERLGRT